MKNKKITDKETYSKLLTNIALQSIFVIITCFLSVFLVKFVSNDYKLTWEVLAFSGGIIIPAAVILGFANDFMLKRMYKQFADLAEGLERAVEGDFYAKLDPNKAGNFTRVYKNFNKVTDELKNVRNMQDDFVNNYSHEFKTPITSIKGFSEILVEQDLSKEEQKKYLNIILKETERLTSLAEESILMTKLNAQEIIEDKRYYSLSEQIRNCVVSLEPQLRKKNIEIEGDIAEVLYNGNPNLMIHLWTNLIDNSIKYTKKNGKIGVSVKEDRDNIIVVITDNGTGMTKEQIHHIFEKYYQVDKSKTSKGLGLGLTIVHRIIELVEGEINVSSEVGRGSMFKITLPK